MTIGYRTQNVCSGCNRWHTGPTANITAYSDIRVKENIRQWKQAKVNQLEGVTYDRIDEDELEDINGRQIGLIAQQVEPMI